MSRVGAFNGCARTERRDLQLFECRRDKGFERPAVELALDESSPIRLARGRESVSNASHARSLLSRI
jgi:hypothetical protein